MKIKKNAYGLPPKRSTKALLEETLDIITATFWIQGDEYKHEEIVGQPEKFKSVIVVPNTTDPSAQRPNEVVWNEDHTKGEAKVTGVCSVGAIALAEMTLYDVPLMGYNHIRDRDVYVKAAEAAVAMSVMENARCSCVAIGARDMDTITGWNDCSATDRAQVIAIFTAALAGPLVKARKIWGYWGFYASWATKAEALKFRAEYNKALKAYDKWCGSEDGLNFYVDDIREDWPEAKNWPPLIVHALAGTSAEPLPDPEVMLEVKA